MPSLDTNTMVPLIKCGYAQSLLLGYQSLGFDPHPIISKAGLPPQIMELDEEFIPHDSVKKLLSLLGDSLEVKQFRQLVNNALQRNSLQRLIGEFTCCETLREALLQTNSIYLHDSTNVNVGLDVKYGETWYWCKRKPEASSSEFIWSEVYAITYIVELVRTLTRSDWQPSKIKVQSLDIEPHRKVISTSCQYFVDCSRIEIYIPDDILDCEIILPERYLNNKEPREDWHSSFTDKVFTALYPYVRDVELTVERSAELLKMSKRTLQRRLGEEGTTFRSIKDSLMFTCAVEMITDGYTLTQIAAQLSFSDLSQFSRSFKRVSGISPAMYRKMIFNLD